MIESLSVIDAARKTRVLLLRPRADIIKSSAHPKATRPPYLLKYAEALLHASGKFEVTFLDCLIHDISQEELIDQVIASNPDMICIYQMSFDQISAENFINGVSRSLDPLFVLCGQGVLGEEVDAENFKPHYTIIVKGEAEEILAELANELREGKTYAELLAKFNKPNKILVKDPNRLPHPRYSLEDLTKYSFYYPLRQNRSSQWGHVLSSRGCPYHCNFCSQVMRESYGNDMRLRNPKDVVQEILYQKDLGVNIISFDDDDFTVVREHVYAICNELIDKNVNLPWIVHARVDEVDREMLLLMKEAGCILLRFGIESASEKILLKLQKGNPRKWINKAKTAFNNANEIGIGTVALFFVGAPGERKEDIDASISLAKELDPDILQISYFTPYPGSSIYEQVKNILRPSDVKKLYHYSKPIFNFSQIDTNELVNYQRKFYREVVLRPRFLIRHFKKFCLFYVSNLRLTFALFNSMLRTMKRRV